MWQKAGALSKKEIKACFARACKVGYTAVAEQLYRTGLFSSEELKKGASCAARHGSDELKSACLQWSDDRSWEDQLQGVFRVMWLCKQTDESILSALPNEMMLNPLRNLASCRTENYYSV